MCVCMRMCMWKYWLPIYIYIFIYLFIIHYSLFIYLSFSLLYNVQRIGEFAMNPLGFLPKISNMEKSWRPWGPFSWQPAWSHALRSHQPAVPGHSWIVPRKTVEIHGNSPRMMDIELNFMANWEVRAYNSWIIQAPLSLNLFSGEYAPHILIIYPHLYIIPLHPTPYHHFCWWNPYFCWSSTTILVKSPWPAANPTATSSMSPRWSWPPWGRRKRCSPRRCPGAEPGTGPNHREPRGSQRTHI